VSALVPSVLTAVAAKWDGPVVAAVEASRELSIARRCADLADLLAAAASGLGRVALVSGQLRGLTLTSVATLRDSGVEVVGLADPGDEQDEVRLLQLGVHSVVAATAPAAVLVGALLHAAGQPGGDMRWAPDRFGSDRHEEPLGGWVPSPRAADGSDTHADSPRNGFATDGAAVESPDPVREKPGRVVVVWGPNGSPGRTAVAVNVSVELSLLGRTVLLVDGDTYGGCVAQTLALLDEAPGIVAAARSADQGSLDRAALARFAVQVKPGLRVLTGIAKAERWPEIRAAALERVLLVCRSLADDVIVDVGFSLEDDEELSYDTQAPRRNQATLTALAAADTAIAVGGCDPISLQRLVRGLHELGTVRAPVPMVVINRLRPGPVGSPPGRLVADALARFAGVTDVDFIPDDPSAFDAAMLAGRALAEIAPTAPGRRALMELAARLNSAAPIGSPGLSASPGSDSRRGRRQTERRWGRRRR